MQIATTDFDRNATIPIPCKWGDYRVVATTDIYMNGQPAKLLTIAARDEIEELPEFPLKEITKPRQLIWHICRHDDDEI